MTPPDPDENPEADAASGETIFKFKKKVDDDWKKKVEEEKERLSEPPREARRERPRGDARPAQGAPGAPGHAAPPPPPAAAAGAADADAPAEPEGEFEDERSGGPAATPFLRFVGDLANQALTALGVYPDPMTRTRQVSLEQARYIIDVLRILKEKTKGNLTPDEQRVVDGLVYELQLQYVEMTR